MQSKITFRVPDELAAGFETFTKTHSQGTGTRQEAMRFILRDWLLTQGYLETGDHEGANRTAEHGTLKT